MAVYRIRGPQVVHETVDGEVIAIDFATGSYYSLRDGAEAAWSSLAAEEAPTAEVVAAAVAVRFPEHGTVGGVGAFLDQLVDEGLIVRDGPASGGAMNGLTFEKFTDMEELILLDPVHDVSEAGWPNAPA
jgi:hypothetical protein